MNPHPPGGTPRLVCRCVGISSRQIIAAVRKHEAHDLESIQRETRAGTACETCHPEVVAILTELAGGALPAHQVAEHQRRCQQETERKLDGVLGSRVAPELPPGVEVELLRAEGLEVWIQLDGPDSLQPEIRQRLRKLVCPELEVRFRAPGPRA